MSNLNIPDNADVRPIDHNLKLPEGSTVQPIAPEIAASNPLPDALAGPDTSNITAKNAIENSPAFRKSLQDAWFKSGNGQKRSTEGAFYVDQSGKESPIQVAVGDDKGGKVTMDVPDSSPIVAHTHDFSAMPGGPSPHDVQTAKDSGHQIITATRDGLYETDATGKTSRVMKNLDWLSKKPAN